MVQGSAPGEARSFVLGQGVPGERPGERLVDADEPEKASQQADGIVAQVLVEVDPDLVPVEGLVVPRELLVIEPRTFVVPSPLPVGLYLALLLPERPSVVGEGFPR